MALSANRTLQIRNTGNMMNIAYQIKTGVKFYKHAFGVWGGTSKKALLPANATSSHFLGLCDKEYTTSLATALVTANFLYNMEVRAPVLSTTGCTTGAVGDTLYCAGSDDDVHMDNTLGPPCGRATEFDGTSYVWVLLGHLTLGNAS